MRSHGYIYFAFVATLITGCPGEEEQPPTADETGGTSTGVVTEPTVSATTPTEASNTSPTSPSEPTSTTTPTTGETESVTDTETTNPECDADGCWNCPAETPEQLLNACTDASCEPFDNAARLPLLEDGGSLPPIP